MVLNYECVRDVLIYLEQQNYVIPSEESVAFFQPVKFSQISTAMPEYPKEDVFYALFNLKQAEYISADTDGRAGEITVFDVSYITFKGHEFLAKIKDKEKWFSIKKVLSGIKDYSLAAIGAVAQGITGSLIESFVNSKR